jgi:hypothetical protein
MANGFCPALLRQVGDIAEANDPAKKLHIAGFLASLFCCQNSSVSPIGDGLNDANGHLRPLTVSYRQRPTESVVQDEDDCDVNRIPARAEWSLPSMNYKQTSFFIEDALVQQYCEDASVKRGVGVPPTSVMNEVYGLILEHANILMKVINADLVTEMATQFGTNVTIDSDAGKVINISKNGNEFLLTDGVVDMLRDIQENEICGDACFVGGGLFSAFQIAQTMACCNQAGFDISKWGMPTFKFDKDTQSIWGDNAVGMFAKGSVKFLGRNRFGGRFSGEKGGSFFTTLPMPVGDFGCNTDDCLRDLRLDMQLKYIDCPQEISINGTPTAVGRGWQVILSKYYNLWVMPTSAYQSGDPLEGTNGTLLYFFTNLAESPGAYAYGTSPS